MPDPVPNPELLRSLGRLVRGLSALFWGLPITLLVCFYAARGDVMRSFGVGPPLLTTGLLVFGLWQLGDFQKQERVWRIALDRALILSIVNFFLSPFLYWWNKIPANSFFFAMVVVLTFSALCFLASLNLVLRRLGAMLPDEALRLETKQFTALNLNLLCLTFLLALAYLVLGQFHTPPRWLSSMASLLDQGSPWLPVLLAWVPVLLVLLPLALTMALLWKTKEVILDSVFGAGRHE